MPDLQTSEKDKQAITDGRMSTKKRTTQFEIKSKILVIETKLDEFSGDATLMNIPPCVKSPRKHFS